LTKTELQNMLQNMSHSSINYFGNLRLHQNEALLTAIHPEQLESL
jgi:hypothetical protein